LVDLTLLHLSDFHLRSSSVEETNVILGTLVEDAEVRIPSLNLPDPYIVLSGDLAYGGREEEYGIVDDFVGSLKRLHPRRMEYCGGNHDVNWSFIDPLNAELMNAMVEHPSSISDAEKRFAIDADRALLQKGMTPYYNFLEAHGIKSSSDLYYIDSTEVGDVKVNFISLNSAYLFARKYNYHGYVGKRQFENAFHGAEDADLPTFNVTIVHHPLEAMVPVAQENTKRELLANSDVILNGHVHSPRVSVEYSAGLLGRTRTGAPPVISCARCVFDEAHDPTVSSGYYIIGIDFEFEKVKEIKIWEVEFNRQEKKWYYNERKRTYPLTVSVGASPQIGPKVTDEERQLLSRWKRANA
jgi:predicted MPP superfamily phosphohydrolase